MSLGAHAVEKKPSGKPLSPLQVSITPAQSNFSPENVKQGDVVEFRITGKTATDTDKLKISVKLQGGLRLISGDSTWVGALKKGEVKSWLISVKVLKNGVGEIVKVRVSSPNTSGASFTSFAEYRIGRKASKKPELLPDRKMDGKGRSIREYKAQ